MKTLYLIGGTMGVGKTTVCRELKNRLPGSVFLDGDWCWDMSPFIINRETTAMVTDNICHLLNNFLKCSHLENILFCWVLHRQEIIDDLLCRLDRTDCQVICISLTCSEDTLRRRLVGDIARGEREGNILQRSIPRLPLYQGLKTIKIDTDEKTPAQIAGEIMEIEA